MGTPPKPGEQASGVSAGHKTFLDIKAGPPGSSSHLRAVHRIRAAVEEAAGTVLGVGEKRVPIAVGAADPVAELIANLGTVMGWHPDPGPETRYRRPDHVTPVLARPNWKPAEDLADELGLGSLPTPEPTVEVDRTDYLGRDKPEHPGRSYLPYLVVPRRWIGRLTRPRGRGAKRSERGYHLAALLLAYVVFMYRQPGRFAGDLLHLDAAAMRDLLCVTQREYVDAVRYLSNRGFITRIMIRGRVPWDPRSRGRYTFVVPRVDRVRALMDKSWGGDSGGPTQ